MKIESIDAYFLRMPEVRDIGDGSQDALLIRISGGGYVGWGECEASPLATLAAMVTPMSHSACHPVLDSVLGSELDSADSIAKTHNRVREQSSDLLQADHALSGIDIALWDLLARKEGAPVWTLLGRSNRPKTAYASMLFGSTPSETFEAAKRLSHTRFRVAKFGWGPIGRGSAQDDRDQLAAAREGLGHERKLCLDTGCVFGRDVAKARSRAALFDEFDLVWWEEPFAGGALKEYAELAHETRIPLAGGEGAHTADQARHLVDYGGVKYLQVDAGRIGGITAARQAAVYAARQGISFVNHTFTSNLALSASLQPYADLQGCYAEVPVTTSELARAIGGLTWDLDPDGCIKAPETPGLGVHPDLQALHPYLQEVEITWNGTKLWPRYSTASSVSFP